jgi:hypothetical protein
MFRATRGDRPTVFRAMRLVGLLVLLSSVIGCARAFEPSAPASASATDEPATASPTVVAPTDAPPSQTDPPASVTPTAGLVLHLTLCGHTGCHGPGTTILDDRRVLWSDNFGRPIESRLRPEAFRDVVAELEASDVLDRSGNYSQKLRPGAEPPGHGLNSFLFDLVRDGQRVRVSAVDPASFQGEEEFWIISPEMHELAELAHRLVDPLAWLGSDAFTEPIRPYQAATFLVAIHLYRMTGGLTPDVDDVRWPFGEPIESVGVPFEAGGDADSRCLLIDAVTASQMVVAEQSAGVQREIRDWSSSIDYAWPRVGGDVTVELTHLLPYESGTCVELATTLP